MTASRELTEAHSHGLHPAPSTCMCFTARCRLPCAVVRVASVVEGQPTQLSSMLAKILIVPEVGAAHTPDPYFLP